MLPSHGVYSASSPASFANCNSKEAIIALAQPAADTQSANPRRVFLDATPNYSRVFWITLQITRILHIYGTVPEKAGCGRFGAQNGLPGRATPGWQDHSCKAISKKRGRLFKLGLSGASPKNPSNGISETVDASARRAAQISQMAQLPERTLRR